MAGFRVPWKTAVLGQDLPTTGAGSGQNQAVVNRGVVGVNLYGTGKGQGIPKNSSYGMIALDGVIVLDGVNLGAAVKENDPIYITSANAVTSVASGNTLLGYADEPKASGASVTIGVRIKSQAGV